MGTLYGDKLRYVEFGPAHVERVLKLAKIEDIEHPQPPEMFGHQDPNAIAWCLLHGAELLELDAAGRTLSTGARLLIRDCLTSALRDGLTDQQLSDEILFQFGYPREAASAIARTEVQLALGWGSLCGALRVGMEVKRWLVSNDVGICPDCRANADQRWIPIREPFPSGAMAPLDHAGCRCDVAYSRTAYRAADTQ